MQAVAGPGNPDDADSMRCFVEGLSPLLAQVHSQLVRPRRGARMAIDSAARQGSSGDRQSSSAWARPLLL